MPRDSPECFDAAAFRGEMSPADPVRGCQRPGRRVASRRLSISRRKLICRNPSETRRINTPFPLNVPVMQPLYISLVCHALGPTATTLSRTRLISPRTNRVTLRKKQRTGGERPGTGGPRRAGSLFRSNYWLKVRRGSLERSFTSGKKLIDEFGTLPVGVPPFVPYCLLRLTCKLRESYLFEVI